MKRSVAMVLLVAAAGVLVAVYAIAKDDPKPAGFDAVIAANSQKMLDDGRKVFRYDTFGDEVFWGDTLKLHQAIAGEKNGGVGPGVSPKTALSVGLKVDMDGRCPLNWLSKSRPRRSTSTIRPRRSRC